MNPKNITNRKKRKENKTTEKMGKEDVVHNPITGNHFFLFLTATRLKNTKRAYKKDFPTAAVPSMEGYTCQNDVMFVS